MAVEKNADGTYQVSGVTFATAEQAFAYDSSRKAEKPASAAAPPLLAQKGSDIRSASVRTRSTTRRHLPLVAVGLLAVIAGALYYGPHWTLYRMRAAVESRDAPAFSSHVDFPALREDVKGQLMIKMASVMQKDEMKNNPFAGLGQMLAVGMVNQMVETFVSPAGVMMMMSEGKASVQKDAPAVPPPIGSGKEAPKYDVSYTDWSTVVLRSTDVSAAGAFVLKRQGLFSWKLAAVQLPV